MTLAEFRAICATTPTISVEDASKLLGISRASAFAAAKTGQIPAIRIGRRLVVPARKIALMLGLEPEAV